ncbi:MAG: DNA phosphorothioation-associated putative methyltransferase [Cyanobacterium sp.]
MTINLSLDWVNDFVKITQLARQSAIGKHLPNHLYVHISALQSLDITLQAYEKKAREIIKNIDDFTLVKFNLQEPKISYLFYPDFDINPHPAIEKSILVNLQEKNSKIYSYSSSENPAILHRKETFITKNYPHYKKFADLTTVEEKLGLLDNSKYIGTKKEWQNLLRDHNLSFIDHQLVCFLNKTEEDLYKVDRHRAAMVRNRLSRPVRLALEAGLFLPEYTFFDYGCGHGKDVEVMTKEGFESAGWDPYYQPHNELKSADVVNLGYIINVIENLQERRQSLVKAWELTKEVLIVSAQVLVDDRQRGFMAYADGIITERNTFQKYYEQEELKIYIEQILKTEAIPAGLGVYFVFRDSTKGNSFRASRFHSKVRSPRVLSPLKKFADYQELLQPLMEFYAQRGRLPVKGEIVQEEAIKAEFSSFKRAFRVILQVTKEDEWEAIADQRRQDILLYLALSRFEKRPTIRQLSAPLKEDIKALFGNYQAACFLADEMLISLRNLDIIKQICQQNCPVGKVFEKSFLVHINELNTLPTLLRLFEGCASRTIGRMEGATLIRFYFNLPQIGYLNVPDFDTEKEPLVQATMTINLSDLRVRYQKFPPNQAPRIKDKEKLINKA